MLTDKFFIIAKIGHESTLWILVLLSIMSIAFIIERYVALSQALKKSNSMKIQIQETLQSNTIKSIDELNRDKESVEGRALSYGLRHVKEYGAKGLEEVFNAHAHVERPELEKRLNFLATVGSNAPFIGLLGTVFGIMDAFRSLAQQSEIQTVLLGISQALIATAVGLLVAIPAVIAYNFFQKQVKRIMQNLDGTKELCVAYAKAIKGGN